MNLKDVNVEYILNLVNFHSVDFSGLASGQASVKGIMGSPQAHARLSVRDFEFEQGRMGTLHANVDWELQEGQNFLLWRGKRPVQPLSGQRKPFFQ